MWRWYEGENFMQKMDEFHWFVFGMSVGVSSVLMLWLISALTVGG